MSGYKNGDSTLPEDATISAPNASNSTANGSSHHFFSCRRNIKNSFSNGHIRCAENNRLRLKTKMIGSDNDRRIREVTPRSVKAFYKSKPVVSEYLHGNAGISGVFIGGTGRANTLRPIVCGWSCRNYSLLTSRMTRPETRTTWTYALGSRDSRAFRFDSLSSSVPKFRRFLPRSLPSEPRGVRYEH